jgi:hypothetical protein
MEDHLTSAVRNCVFNIFAAAIRIYGGILYPRPESMPCRAAKHWMFEQNETKLTVKRCGVDSCTVCSMKVVDSCNHAQTVLVPQVASQERHRLEIALSRLYYIIVNPFRSVQQLVSNAITVYRVGSLSFS